jgi:hypothetical protein
MIEIFHLGNTPKYTLAPTLITAMPGFDHLPNKRFSRKHSPKACHGES